MKLIATKHGKADKYDTLRCVRRDGTWTEVRMPRQGILPHDLIHAVVEDALGYRHGFLGVVAAGADIDFAMSLSHTPTPGELAELTHAEAIVESLQAQLWSGDFDAATFGEGVRAACTVRGCAAPGLDGVDARERLFGAALALGRCWQQVPPYGTLEFEMPAL